MFLLTAAATVPAFGQSFFAPDGMSERAAARFLDQGDARGPTPASVAQFQQMGIVDWLREQMALNTSDIPDQSILTATGTNNNNLAPVQAAFFQNAITGPDQLRQRVAFALSEIWVVSDVSINWAYAFPPYWRLFRDNAFGNYRDLIKAVTLSPAMGTYLSMANNNKANAATGTAANENYAREIMQLFTLGLNQLRSRWQPRARSDQQPRSDVQQCGRYESGESIYRMDLSSGAARRDREEQ